MKKLLVLMLISFNAYSSSNDFLLILENYESFGGAIPVKVVDARAQVISESFSQTEKKCYKRTGFWSSESEPYEAKQNIKINITNNDLILESAKESLGMTSQYVRRKAPSFCQIKSKAILLVKAVTIDTNKEVLLHGEIRIDLDRDEFYFESGARYYFLQNPLVSMLKMPRMPEHIQKEVWENINPRNSRIQTNF